MGERTQYSTDSQALLDLLSWAKWVQAAWGLSFNREMQMPAEDGGKWQVCTEMVKGPKGMCAETSDSICLTIP